MQSDSVRKFAISVDPDEVVDFVESIGYFEEQFTTMGFEKVGTYRFRYKDEECTITINLESATDGYEVWVTVQAEDAHDYRIGEIAAAPTGRSIISGAGTGRHPNRDRLALGEEYLQAQFKPPALHTER